jgi:hypothetical protein
MVVKAVEMVRKIRDRQYEKTKDLTIEEQIRYIKERSMRLQKGLVREKQRLTADKMTQTSV